MNKDSKPNQAYLWSNGVYHTKPESIATQEYANLIELQQKRIEELEELLSDWAGVDSAEQAEWWDERRLKLLPEGGADNG